jgi:hypothetical protein
MLEMLMTLLCSSQLTRPPVRVERVSGAVARATDFSDTVVRLAWFSSTGSRVGQSSG